MVTAQDIKERWNSLQADEERIFIYCRRSRFREE